MNDLYGHIYDLRGFYNLIFSKKSKKKQKI